LFTERGEREGKKGGGAKGGRGEARVSNGGFKGEGEQVGGLMRWWRGGEDHGHEMLTRLA
jgi:hypothetical protein